MNTLLGIKKTQTQRFLEDGTRIPVTMLDVSQNTVVFVKQKDKNGYFAVQLGFGARKNANKALIGHTKGAGLKTAPRFLREVRLADGDAFPAPGDAIMAPDVFKPGDIIEIAGISKGKGYAGVVKRHHFKGGPRTHGQSDRERAPGSIGQTTTPGRVYKGKRMSGRMGHEQVTIKNLRVVDVSDTDLIIKGLVPGAMNGLIVITKIGEDKKFVPLYKEDTGETKEPQVQSETEGQVKEVITADAGKTQQPVQDVTDDDKKEEKKEEVVENAS